MNAMYQIMDRTLIEAGAGSIRTNRGGVKQTQGEGRSDFESALRGARERTANGQGEQSAGTQPAEARTPDAPGETIPIADDRYVIAAALMFRAQPELSFTVLPDGETTELPAQTPDIAIAAPQLLNTAAVETDVTDVRTPVSDIGELPIEPQAEPVRIEAQADSPIAAANEAPAETAPSFAGREAPTTHLEAPAQERPAAEPAVRAVQPQRETARSGEDESGESALPQWEAPVFGYMEAAPVKVAPAKAAPVPLEAEDGVEQLAGQLEAVIVDAAQDRVEITLTPESLGRLTVEIARGTDGSLQVAISASTAKAAALLEKNTGSLQHLLTAASRPEVQVQVRGSEEAQRQFPDPDDRNGRNGQNPQQQRRQQGRRQETEDFVRRLRLGLVDLAAG